MSRSVVMSGFHGALVSCMPNVIEHGAEAAAVCDVGERIAVTRQQANRTVAWMRRLLHSCLAPRSSSGMRLTGVGVTGPA